MVFTRADEAGEGTVLAGQETVGCLGEEYEVGVGNASKHIKPTGLQQCLE